jgi:hypothetical protein
VAGETPEADLWLYEGCQSLNHHSARKCYSCRKRKPKRAQRASQFLGYVPVITWDKRVRFEDPPTIAADVEEKHIEVHRRPPPLCGPEPRHTPRRESPGETRSMSTSQPMATVPGAPSPRTCSIAFKVTRSWARWMGSARATAQGPSGAGTSVAEADSLDRPVADLSARREPASG